MTSAIFPIRGYPTAYSTPGGTQVTIRPMIPADKDSLLDFFCRIPPKDRLYLRDDVTSPHVIARWAETLDYRRVLPLLALDSDKIIGDATLHHSRIPAHRHIGEVRVVIDPAYRNQGLGRFLLQNLVNIAKSEERGLEKILFEVVASTEKAAHHAAQTLGFVPVAVFARHVRYYGGEPHDLLVMELRIGVTEEERKMADPAKYMF